jgi:hypothetical protein
MHAGRTRGQRNIGAIVHDYGYRHLLNYRSGELDDFARSGGFQSHLNARSAASNRCGYALDQCRAPILGVVCDCD